jgi:SAM-dependent methyltransferase
MSSPDRYIHGSAPEEQRRLTRLNELLNDATLRELALTGGEQILDVGSGIGQLTRAMARAAGPTGRVLGIERDPGQLGEAMRQARSDNEEHLAEFRSGDALDLPLGDDEWGGFDLVHTRFLLEHVADPLGVVRAMVRAARPGGRIVLTDDDHDILRLWPEPPGLAAVWQAYVRSYDRLGNDPFVGRRLVGLLHAAGAVPTRNHWLFFGSCVNMPTFPVIVDNLQKILLGAREPILATGHVQDDAIDRSIVELETWRLRPDAALWFAMCWAEGTRTVPE